MTIYLLDEKEIIEALRPRFKNITYDSVNLDVLNAKLIVNYVDRHLGCLIDCNMFIPLEWVGAELCKQLNISKDLISIENCHDCFKLIFED